MSNSENKKIFELDVEFKNMKEDVKELKTDIKSMATLASDITHIKEILEKHILTIENVVKEQGTRIRGVEVKQDWLATKISSFLGFVGVVAYYLKDKFNL